MYSTFKSDESIKQQQQPQKPVYLFNNSWAFLNMYAACAHVGGGGEEAEGKASYPIKLNATSSWRSKGKSMLKEVLKRAVMVSSALNQTAASWKRKAPHTAPKNPRQ